MASHNELGKWGEGLAKELLIAKGYTIVEENWRLGHFEIDLIASFKNRIIFVEVKTRSTHFNDPADAVNSAKQQRMARAADAYIRQFNIPLEAQFDIITIIGTEQHHEVEHIPDAFLPPLRSYR